MIVVADACSKAAEAQQRTMVNVSKVSSSVDGREVKDYFAFKITPEAGVLRPSQSVEFSLAFSPLEILFDYRAHLKCRYFCAANGRKIYSKNLPLRADPRNDTHVKVDEFVYPLLIPRGLLPALGVGHQYI